MNMFEASQLMLVVVVWASRFSQVQCDVYVNLTDSDECRRMCQGLNETKLAASCMKECLLKTKASRPPLKRFLNYTAVVPRVSPTAEAWKNDCPLRYGPEPNEVIPGEVSGLIVTFAHEKKENTQGWVARVSWTAPKGANASLNWRGYLIIWFSHSDSVVSYGGEAIPARCKLVSKSESYLVINETDGWKYPNNIYITVVALPSNDERTELQLFHPRTPDWGTPIQFKPVSMKDRKRFRLQSPEVIAILIVAGLITAVAIICIIKLKGVKGFHVGFKCNDEKKAGKKENEMKDQLIV